MAIAIRQLGKALSRGANRAGRGKQRVRASGQRSCVRPVGADELADELIAAGLGPDEAERIAKEGSEKYRRGPGKYESELEAATEALAEAIERECTGGQEGKGKLNERVSNNKREVIMLVGTNGSGKTTTAGKLAHALTEAGARVALVAGDTFRAGAEEQLTEWANALGVPIHTAEGGDKPSKAVHNGIQAALAQGSEAVIVDTGGRQHNRNDLMAELGKCTKAMERATGDDENGTVKEVLLVADASVGLDTVAQLGKFKEQVGVTGMAIAKADSGRRLGSAIAASMAMAVPVKAVGTGEKRGDALFNPDANWLARRVTGLSS